MDRDFWEYVVNRKLRGIAQLTGGLLVQHRINMNKRTGTGVDWYDIAKKHQNKSPHIYGSDELVSFLFDNSFAVRSYRPDVQQSKGIPEADNFLILASTHPAMYGLNDPEGPNGFVIAALNFFNAAMGLVTVQYSPDEETRTQLLPDFKNKMDRAYRILRAEYNRIPPDLRTGAMQFADAIRLMASDDLKTPDASLLLDVEKAMEKATQEAKKAERK